VEYQVARQKLVVTLPTNGKPDTNTKEDGDLQLQVSKPARSLEWVDAAACVNRTHPEMMLYSGEKEWGVAAAATAGLS
jgi:hypothetical protein